MSSQAPPNPPATSSLMDQLAPRLKQIGLVLACLFLAYTSIIIYQAYQLYTAKGGSLTTVFWGVGIDVLLIATGLVGWYAASAQPTRRLSEPDQVRILILMVAGGGGLLTALFGVALAFSSPPFAAINYRDIFAGGVKAWRDPANGHANAWAIARCVFSVVFGLALMFAGLQMARAFERTSQGMRRLVYGYNAVLSTLLIGFILLLLNAVSYTNAWPFKALGATYDWTGARMYSLSDSTQNLLTSLKEPVKVYLLLSRSNPISIDAEELMKTCQQANEQLTWQSLSPDINHEEVEELAQKYHLSNTRGMLVVYGREGNEKSEFTREDDLIKFPDRMKNPEHYVFRGEEFLQKSLISLSQNNKQTVVYFTQGHGEPDMNNSGGGPNAGQPGLGVLVEELRKRNYDVRELKIDLKTKEVPGDADIVVVVDPWQRYTAQEEGVLRSYLAGKSKDKKGHLMVLLDVHTREGKMAQTGLEGLLADYGVRAGDDRLVQLAIRDSHPLQVLTMADTTSKNPIARAFFARRALPTPFLFDEVRTLQKLDKQGGSHTVDTIIVAPRDQLLVRQTNLDQSALAFWRELKGNVNKANELLEQKHVPVGMAVSEGNALARIPGHEGMGQEEKPVLVVFGDSSWATNRWVGEVGKLGQSHADLFASCLAWLRERPDIGANVTEHERQYFRLNMAPGGLVRLRVLMLPLALLVVAVLGMGLGVWVIRRR